MENENEIEIRRDDHGDGGRYHLLVDGADVGELDYRTADGVRAFTHTGVREEVGGRGLAAHLVARGLADARADGVLVEPLCPYVRRYVEHHHVAQDLLVPTARSTEDAGDLPSSTDGDR